MTARILGIDPGHSGALALLTLDGALTVEDMPALAVDRGGKAKREISAAALAEMVRRLAPTHAVLERVGAMPGQGVSSMFAFGRGVGQIEGVLATLAVPVTYAAPAAWKRAMGVQTGKDAARLRASQLLPAYAERWRRVRDDGRAEAALIALWGLAHAAAVRGGA